MSDNIKLIEDSVNQTLDKNLGISGIKVDNHKAFVLQMLSKLGKYTGFPFVAINESPLGVTPSGSFSWNNNPMNETNDFVVTFSKNTIDNNDIGFLLSKLSVGDLIKFKDYEGRSVFLEYKSYITDVDSSNNDVYNVTVSGLAENTNFAYSSTTQQLCVVDFYMSGGANSSTNKIIIDGYEFDFKARNNSGGTTAVPVAGDLAYNGQTNANDYDVDMIYVSGDPTLGTSWDKRDYSIVNDTDPE